jgi:hypothetical protein
MIFRISSGYFYKQHKSAGDTACPLLGRNWTFKYYLDYLQAPKFHVAQFASYTVLHVTPTSLLLKIRKTLLTFFHLFKNSPFPDALPSSVQSALPFFRFTFVRRTRGYCLGIFKAGSFSVPPRKMQSLSVSLSSLLSRSLSLSLSLCPSGFRSII